MPETSPLEQLRTHLKAEWKSIFEAKSAAVSKRDELAMALNGFATEDTSIVIFGSLARNEFTSGSDIDWTLLVDGFANSDHLDTSLAIARHVQTIEGRPPGREGTFGGLAFSHSILHLIGGGDDTNKNMTQRILLMLESASITRDEAYERVLKNVLKRYIVEDYGLLNATGPFTVPRFLQNDVLAIGELWQWILLISSAPEATKAGRSELRSCELAGN